MPAEISVDDAVCALRPDFAALVITVRGLAGGPSDDASRELLIEAAKNAADPAEHPHVAAWRDAYRLFGAKPKRTRPSVEALPRAAGQELVALLTAGTPAAHVESRLLAGPDAG